MTALLTRIIPCEITQWVKPHHFVLLKICTGVYGFIRAELEDTNIFTFSMIGQAVLLLLLFEVQDSILSPACILYALWRSGQEKKDMSIELNYSYNGKGMIL